MAGFGEGSRVAVAVAENCTGVNSPLGCVVGVVVASIVDLPVGNPGVAYGKLVAGIVEVLVGTILAAWVVVSVG